MSKKAVISGGYYIKARIVQGSFIAHAPPAIRETWEWMLRQANHTDAKYNGRLIKRGQLFCSWRDIQEGLSWYIGFRKMMYSQSKCENATKVLTKAEMITATKTERGRIITIVNYDLYQNPANYEYRTERRTERRSHAEVMPNDKNKEEEELKNEYSPNSQEFRLAKLLFDLIRERKPDFKQRNLQDWAKHIDWMIRLDHRTPDRVAEVIRWCQQDDFWQNNILCTEKLRAQFDQLDLKAKAVQSAGKEPKKCFRCEQMGVDYELDATGQEYWWCNEHYPFNKPRRGRIAQKDLKLVAVS